MLLNFLDFEFNNELKIIKHNSLYIIENKNLKVPLFVFMTNNGFFLVNNINLLLTKFHQNLTFNKNLITKTIFEDNDTNYPNTETYFKNVYRILPFTQCKIENNKITFQESDEHDFGKITSDLIKNEFVEIFKNSINSCIKNAQKVTSIISGGLDSSSISIFLKKFNLVKDIETVECRSDKEINPERKYAKVVVDQFSFKHTILNNPLISIEEISLFLQSCSAPYFLTPSIIWHMEMAKFTKKNGSDVLFSGSFGDQSLFSSQIYVKQLYENKEIVQFKKVIKNYNNYFFWVKILEKNCSIRNIWNFLIFSRKKVNVLNYLLKNWIFYFRINGLKKQKKHVTNEFYLKFKNYGENKLYYNSIFTQHGINLIDFYHDLGDYYKIKVCLPFLDKNIMNFFKNIPAETHYNFPQEKGVFREALKDILPRELLTRNTKTSFGLVLNDYTKNLAKEFLNNFDKYNQIWKFVDEKKFRLQLINYLKKNEFSINQLFFIQKVIITGVWLEAHKSN